MRNLSATFAVLLLSLVAVSGLPVTMGKDLPADKPESTDSYYPPSESSGGWRRPSNDEEIRRVIGIDPEVLDLVGEEGLQEWGNPWSIVVIRRGYLVREWFAVPAMQNSTYDVWSCTKSATGIAYGLLFEDSRNHKLPKDAQIDLDSRAMQFVPEAYPLSDPRKEQITVRQLLTMTSGIRGEDRGILGTAAVPGNGEFELAMGRQPNRFGHSTATLYTTPGEGWDYSDSAIMHLALIFFHVTGREIADVMNERVIKPIGIESFAWDVEGGGGHIGPHTNAHSGLRLSARDFARLGYLMLRNGNWKGNQLVAKWWIDMATRSSQKLNPEYGFTFWVNTDGSLWPGLPKDAFAFMGALNNRCYIVPSLDLVVVRTGYGPSPLGPVDSPLRGVVNAIIK